MILWRNRFSQKPTKLLSGFLPFTYCFYPRHLFLQNCITATLRAKSYSSFGIQSLRPSSFYPVHPLSLQGVPLKKVKSNNENQIQVLQGAPNNLQINTCWSIFKQGLGFKEKTCRTQGVYFDFSNSFMKPKWFRGYQFTKPIGSPCKHRSDGDYCVRCQCAIVFFSCFLFL